MIKKWLRFNENLDSFESSLKENFEKIRDIFIDFEDLKIIEYGLCAKGNEEYYDPVLFVPNISDDYNFIKYNASIIKSSLNSRSKNKICFKANIKLPAKEGESTFSSSVLNSKAIELFDDIATSFKRLTNSGYEVMIDMNSNNRYFKPVIFLIYTDMEIPKKI